MNSVPSSARIVAFYLPQFHAIPENDRWWGPGFTEWSNVRRARPLFPGHDQPRVPEELGYYDLNDVQVLERQADLARAHGIEGFCFYYYFFGKDQRLLEMPLERLLQSSQPGFPFCLCWANENWSRRWDGGDDEILMRQSYEAPDLEAFARSVVPFFQDPRYIRVDGRPLLIVYRARAVPETASAFRRMRDLWRAEAGLEVHICAALTFAEQNAGELGVDASVGFPPHNLRGTTIEPEQMGLGSGFQGRVEDYLQIVNHERQKPDPEPPFYPGVMAGWDNTARRGEAATIYVNANAAFYQSWLMHAVDQSIRINPPGQAFVFINAWNEWAEGAYLEPDDRRGRLYLEATRMAHGRESLLSSLMRRIEAQAPLSRTESDLLRELLIWIDRSATDASNVFERVLKVMQDQISDLMDKRTLDRAKRKRQRAKLEAERTWRRESETSLIYRSIAPLVRLEGRVRSRSAEPRRAVSLPPRRVSDAGRVRPASRAGRALNWIEEGVLRFDTVELKLAIDDDLPRLESTPERLILGKSRDMVERLAGWMDELQPRRIVEVGVYKGGGVALLNEYCRPEKLVAIERNPHRNAALDAYIERVGAKGQVEVCYGTDQADLGALSEICHEEFESQPIDLVVDDASHFQFETRETFRELFPRLRPGGLYVVEDWAWAHWPGPLWQEERGGAYFRGKEPLSNLVLELGVLTASAPDVVAALWLGRAQVAVWRGPLELEAPFNPERYVLNRGRPLPRVE